MQSRPLSLLSPVSGRCPGVGTRKGWAGLSTHLSLSLDTAAAAKGGYTHVCPSDCVFPHFRMDTGAASVSLRMLACSAVHSAGCSCTVSPHPPPATFNCGLGPSLPWFLHPHPHPPESFLSTHTAPTDQILRSFNKAQRTESACHQQCEGEVTMRCMEEIGCLCFLCKTQ